MWTSGQGADGVPRRAGTAPFCPASPVSPVQSFLFGHTRAEVVYDCR